MTKDDRPDITQLPQSETARRFAAAYANWERACKAVETIDDSHQWPGEAEINRAVWNEEDAARRLINTPPPNLSALRLKFDALMRALDLDDVQWGDRRDIVLAERLRQDLADLLGETIPPFPMRDVEMPPDAEWWRQ